MQKYEIITDQEDENHGHIRALMDFGDVKKGDIGGRIDSYDNLSQEGDCWVGCDAKVCDDAEVSGDANVCDDAGVSGNAKVYGYAKVYGDAEVYGDAKAYGDAEVYGYVEA